MNEYKKHIILVNCNGKGDHIYIKQTIIIPTSYKKMQIKSQ